MPLIFEYDKGVSNQDEGRTPQGFVNFMQNWVYDPDDKDRVFKIFGKTSSGALPGAATASNTKGFDYLQFDNDNNRILLYANSSFYTQPITQTGTTNPLLSGGWTQITNKSAAAFTRSGDYLKVIPSGDNRYIGFTGAEGERPLVRDEDGDWHYLGMNKPPAPTLSAVNLAAVVTRPTGTHVQSGTTDFGTTTGTFTGDANVSDGNLATYGTSTLTPQTLGTSIRNGRDYKFTGGAIGAAQKLYIVVALSGLPPQDAPGWQGGGGLEPAIANLYVQVSINGGGTWTTIYASGNPLPITTISYDVAAGTTFANLWVRIVHEYVAGEATSRAYVYEIYSQTATTAGAAFIDAGTYYYCTTEVYQVTLASGKTVFIEGVPSDPVGITIAASTSYGIQLTLGAQTNVAADGYSHDPANKRLLYRNVYRTTKSGVWPDLGYIGQATIAATTFVDDFARVGSTTLGVPGINVVYAGVSALNAANPAPDFADAVFFRGAIVAIPAKDPYRIQWSLPGFPDYWPIPAQDTGLLPSVRNDKLLALTAVGEYLILFTRTRILRLRDLPFVDRPNFDITRIQVDILSPNEGIAGNPLGYCLFQSQKGYSVCAWIADNGIWMTDGSLPSEGGLGIVKLTANLNWRRLVDTNSLLQARLCYDPVLQMILFDFVDVNGNRRTLGLHTAPYHWVETGQEHTVPKISGPHTLSVHTRTIAELGGLLYQFSLDTTDLVIYTERFGVGDAGQPIDSIMETGWQQPAGPQEEFLCSLGSLYHSDWGPSETCNLDLLCRRDDTGVIQEARKSGIPLAGASVSNFYMNRGSKSFRLRLSHSGYTTSNGQQPLRALGPCGFDGEQMDALFGV